MEEAARLAAVAGAVDTIVAAAIATAEGLQHARDSVKDAAAVEAELSRHPTCLLKEISATSAGDASPREEVAETAHATQEEEMKRLRGEVGRARADETAARDEAAVARTKLLELEEAMKESQQSHDSFRERTERRLESLRHAVEDEELEQGAQARVPCLYFCSSSW